MPNNDSTTDLLIRYLKQTSLKVKGLIPLKAENKHYPDKLFVAEKMLENPDKWKWHTKEMDDFKRKLLTEDVRSVKREERYSYFIKCKEMGKPLTGNCGEYANLVFAILSSEKDALQDLLGYEIVILQMDTFTKGDHSFIIVGIASNNKIVECSVVCDPWANIVCKLDHYSLEWKIKMHKWSSRGLQIKDFTFQKGFYDPFYNENARNCMHDGFFKIGRSLGARCKIPSSFRVKLSDKKNLS